MSGSKMTPGPWITVNHSWSETGIYGADGRQIALINIEPEATEETQAELEKVAAADARALAAVPDLIVDLQEAATTLRRYETLHRAKGTSDSDAKAEANAALAARFEATLVKALGK